MKKIIFVFFLLFPFNLYAKKECTFESIYLDEQKNVYLVTKSGKNIKLTKNGKSTRTSLSKDKRTAVWLTEQDWINEDDDEPGVSRLTVYRNRKQHDIECFPFIREYWFWDKGRKIGMFCGGLHFAGTYFLYDSNTGMLIESFHQADIPEEERPAWSLPGSSYHPEDIY